MKKALLAVLCAVFLLGLADMGHAGLWPFGSGGGNSGNSAAANAAIASVCQHNFESIKPKLNDQELNHYLGGYKDQNGQNQLIGSGQLFGQIVDFIHDIGARIEDRRPPVGTAPVPEPATMLLLGMGLIGLAGYGRKRFVR